MMGFSSFLAASLLGVAALGGRVEAEVLVGVADTFSGPGGWGVQIKRSIDLAADEVNEGGGLLGEPVRVTWSDDACDAEQALAAARKMVADGVVFVLGHACSHAAIAASKIYEEAGILYMAASATNPKLTDEGGPNVFRLRGRDDQVTALASDYLAKHGSDKPIAIVHDGRTYGKYLAEAVKQRLNERGIQEAAYETVIPGQLDFSELIAKLQNAGIGIVFFGGYPNEAGLFLRQSHEHGFDLSLVGGDALSDEEFGLIAGSAAEGTLVVDPPRPRDAEAEARYVASYRVKYPTWPGDPADLSPTNYVAFHVWAEAVEIAGSFDAASVADVLRSQEFDTMFGTLGFDDKGDVTGAEMWSWYRWENGRMVEKAQAELAPTE